MNDQQIMTKWKSFPPEQQNMPFTEFRKVLKKLTDPVGIKRDLQDIQRRRIMERMMKAKIDKGLQDG